MPAKRQTPPFVTVVRAAQATGGMDRFWIENIPNTVASRRPDSIGRY
jgi:hypothetical protein